MWTLNNKTPYQAERTFVRDLNGLEVWIVAVKGTWDIHPDGNLTLAEEQEPVCTVAIYSSEESNSGLLYDSDLILTKTSTDVILNGTAYAPNEQDSKEFHTCLEVGPIQKSIRVLGDRYYKKTFFVGSSSSIKPIKQVPIIYENSFGGKDHLENPLGVGFSKKGSFKKGSLKKGDRLPNLLPPETSIFDRWKGKRPIGYGPIPMDWLPRQQYAGTYDETWETSRQPLLPEDFDTRFYQAAASDQQVPGYLKGGEKVTLTNLTPEGDLTFRLPKTFLGFRTDFRNELVTHEATLYTVIIEPDKKRVMTVWHSSVPCQDKEQFLKETTIFEKPNILLGKKAKGDFPKVKL